MSTLGVVVVRAASSAEQDIALFERTVRQVARRAEAESLVLPAVVGGGGTAVSIQVEALVEAGATRVLAMPAALAPDTTFMIRLSGELYESQQRHEGVRFDLAVPNGGERVQEDCLVDRIWPLLTDAAGFSDEPDDAARCQRLVDHRFGGGCNCLRPVEKALLQAVIMASADYSFANNMRLHPQAIDRCVEALRGQCPIICDGTMTAHGMAAYGGEVMLLESLTDWATQLPGAIVVAGERPEPLRQLMSTGVQPAVVIGMPAGFGAALETKQALLRSDLCFMTNIGPRGGVQPTVAALKAMMEFAQRPEAETA